jgi:hypothetical protein
VGQDEANYLSRFSTVRLGEMRSETCQIYYIVYVNEHESSDVAPRLVGEIAIVGA